MATIRDVARLSGYSIGTVSRVMNHHPDVSEEARMTIQKVISDTNFQPNANAKHLKQQISSDIAIVIKGYGNMLFADLLEQVQAILRDSGEEAAVFFLDENSDEVTAAQQICEERKPKGMIFLGGNLESFKTNFSVITAPSVLMTNSAVNLKFENLSSYTTDDAEAAATAIRSLIEAGHTRIGIIGGDPSSSQISVRRLQGSLEEFRRHGIPFDPSIQYETSRFSMAGGYTAAQTLLKRCPDLTGIFAVSDTVAIGGMRALRDSGKHIPEDISVVGYDGIEAGQYCIPRLATIHQDTSEIARRGVEDLLLRINYT
ncbi:MAG: LacI family transcriptional regulator, partial [Erysipelotrichia bacterium]|nr:LacI family transcriptional regulator [Erysipelotrichia bacterium]